MGHEWNVHAEPPFGGPEQLLAYLAQYINRVAITNDRIESYENHQVIFRGRDRGDGQAKSYRLDGVKFVQRYVQHVPPKGFMRIRSYGFMANRNRKQNVERARQLIGQTVAPRRQERVRPMRLCPACYEARRAQGLPCFVARSSVPPRGIANLRPPPSPLAA
jgi:Putative transposase